MFYLTYAMKLTCLQCTIKQLLKFLLQFPKIAKIFEKNNIPKFF